MTLAAYKLKWSIESACGTRTLHKWAASILTRKIDGWGCVCEGTWIRIDTIERLASTIAAIVPELQRRGLFQTDYKGATLRENLGLPRPVVR